MKKAFLIVTAILLTLALSLTETGAAEPANGADKNIYECFDDLNRKLQTLDHQANYLSGKTTELETGTAALDVTTGTLKGESAGLDDTLRTLEIIATASARQNINLNRKASTLESTTETLKKENLTLAEKASLLETAAATLQVQAASLETRTAGYQAFFDHVTVNPDNINGLDGPHVIFTEANIHIRSGSGRTDDPDSGLGNLVLGYNENPFGSPRTGSHNLVLGAGHGYSSWGGFIAGFGNTISSPSATVSGGAENMAGGFASSVSGGRWLEAAEDYSYAPPAQIH